MSVYSTLIEIIGRLRTAITNNSKLIPIQKDITSEYATKQWGVDDIGKKVMIVFQQDGSKDNRMIGFVSSVGTAHISNGSCHIALGMEIVQSGITHTYFYNTADSTSKTHVGVQILDANGTLAMSLLPHYKSVLEFHIWENPTTGPTWPSPKKQAITKGNNNGKSKK